MAHGMRAPSRLVLVALLLLAGARTDLVPRPEYKMKNDRFAALSVVNEADCGVDVEYEREVRRGARLRELQMIGSAFLPRIADVHALQQSHEVLWCEREFLRSLVGTWSDKFMFDVMRVVKVDAPELAAAFARKKAELGGPEFTVFHGTQRSCLLPICTQGLRPNMPSSNERDNGYFGDSRRGVYVTAHADYAMYYSSHPERRPNRRDEFFIPPPDHMSLVMLRCVTGKINKLEGMSPDAWNNDCNSNESGRGLEYFLYDRSMCYPTHILHVRRRGRVEVLHDM